MVCSFEEQPVEEDNPPLIPSMFNCLRNRVFKVLLLNQLVEAIGTSTQFTVLAFVVDYVVDPRYSEGIAADGTDLEGTGIAGEIGTGVDMCPGGKEGCITNADGHTYDTTNGMTTILGGGLLGFELLSIPFWLWLANKQGKYKGYLIWNAVLVIFTAQKFVMGYKGASGVALVSAILWGIGTAPPPPNT